MSEDNGATGAGDAGTATAEPGKTFTQDELDKVVGDRIARERAKYDGFEDLKAKAARLDELEKANQTEVEKLAGERDSLKGELEPTKLENLRLKVAISKKLPPELVDRLRGSTQEELEADADELMKLVEPATTGARPGGHDGGPRGQSAGTPQDMDSQIRKAAGLA